MTMPISRLKAKRISTKQRISVGTESMIKTHSTKLTAFSGARAHALSKNGRTQILRVAPPTWVNRSRMVPSVQVPRLARAGKKSRSRRRLRLSSEDSSASLPRSKASSRRKMRIKLSRWLRLILKEQQSTKKLSLSSRARIAMTTANPSPKCSNCTSTTMKKI